MVPEGLEELGWRGWGRREGLGVEAVKTGEREPEREEQPDDANMPPKFKRHLNDEEVTGSIRSERRNLLEEDSDEEEDFFLRGPTGPRFGAGNDKIRQVQSQVDEVIDVMQENISKVIDRGERLEDLQDKSESLSDNASAFSSRAKQLHRRMWWRDMKMKAIIALVVVVLLLIIIIPVILRYR
ncbi:vesicle-associated membrane protein 4 isoform X1 [Oncorhynchus mykiss]|uniref:V-SNARE coiled-coil homology domain-containing protein n=1 Tax=Oncorhynchus mykiss TaxID=8022 RepID=A0A8C7TIS2_ONCMY|nr:vesicle-associated membrane protein 4 isoform X1 [Oncorhynchus mykiss]XP_021454981.1 vesicle-associated membrane protein 4 isoform X1 [Oncorhynchus mykiss]